MSIHLAIKYAGSASKLAKLLGAPHPSRVTNWVKRGVPAEKCYAIEQALEGRVRCEDLCQDVQWNRDESGEVVSYTIHLKISAPGVDVNCDATTGERVDSTTPRKTA